MNRTLYTGWLVLNVLGAVLSFVVKRRDGTRTEQRSQSLWQKYGSYLVITLFVLHAGALKTHVFMLVVLLGVSWATGELYETFPRASPMQIRMVKPVGLALILAGALGGILIKLLDRTGNAWGWFWLVVATTDAYSQLFGQGWGDAKMVPTLSPGKTWVGFYAGTAFSVLVGWVLAGGSWLAIPVALLTSLAATAGDLVASWMKRTLGIKDFSRDLGHHGGVLDRFDSLLGAAPVFAILLALIRLR